MADDEKPITAEDLSAAASDMAHPLRNRSEPWTGEVPSRDDVIRKLHDGTADMLYLAGFCRSNSGGAAMVLQWLALERAELDRKWRQLDNDIWEIRGDPRDGPPHVLGPKPGQANGK